LVFLNSQVSNINNTINVHTAQINNINNINTTQDSQITNLENRVTALENIQILSTGTNWPNSPNVEGQWTWYKLTTFQNIGPGQNGNCLRPYLLVVRDFKRNLSVVRDTNLLIPEGGFNGSFGSWYLYNNTFSTVRADYSFSISSAGNQLLINFDSKPSGQAFFGDIFFVQMLGF
jgi:hypothetical protein